MCIRDSRPPGRSFADEEDPADARRLSTTVYAPDNDQLKTSVGEWIENSGAAEYEYGHISEWDVSKLTDMSFLFCVQQDWMEDWMVYYEDCVLTDDTFNEAIGAWDTSSVTSMQLTFYKAAAFDADIGGWDTSKVTSMERTFKEASAFNQPIGDWDVSKVTSLYLSLIHI